MIALGLFVGVAAFLTPRIWLGTLANGDEAIYAELAREMHAGSLLDLRYAGHLAFQRPPLYPWILCLSVRLLGRGTIALRLPSVLASAASCSAVYLLGRRLAGRATGAWAALLLPALGLFVLYGRAVESDALLTALVCWAAVAWVTARADGRHGGAWLVGFAGLAGCALLTKQVVGLLAFAAPIADLAASWLGGESFARAPAGRFERRTVLLSLGLFALIVLPWHLAELLRHGRPFLHGYLGVNVLRRAERSLEPTTRTFYLHAAWTRERWLSLVLAGGAIVALLRAARRRDAVDLLCAGWGVGGLCAFSLAATRFDYYALIAYPPLALAAARALTTRVARWPPLGEIALALGVAYGLGAHAWPRLGIPGYGPESFETSALARAAARVARPDETLLVVDDWPFLARYESGLPTLEVDLSPVEWQEHAARYARDLPGGEALVDPSRVHDLLHALPRFLAIVPTAALAHVHLPMSLVAHTSDYALVASPPLAEGAR